MNFFRKLFPLIHKKNTTDTMNNDHIKKREKDVEQYHSQADVDTNLNILESNVAVDYIEDYATDDFSVTHGIDELNSGKIFHTLVNVAPIEISPNDTYKETKGNDAVPEDTWIVNNATEACLVKNVIQDVTLLKTNNIDPNTDEAEVCNNTKDNTEAIDDGKIQNLKEFEEVLDNLGETISLTDNFETEFINLDEFNDLFDELDSVNEDLISENRKVEEIKNYIETDIDPKASLNVIGNIDIISISSSTEDEISQAEEIKDTICINSDSSESHSDDGYNSSDFEFISEKEANTDGFIINYKPKNYQKTSPTNSVPLSSYFGQYIDEENDEEGEKEKSDPGEGPSRQNKPRNEFEDRSYRNNHHIPIGDDYLGLFQGIYNPLLPVSEIYFLENKSVRASAMNSQYDGIGFDKQLALRRHQPDSSEDEFEDEAKESAKKILNMYPRENRKRRRRH